MSATGALPSPIRGQAPAPSISQVYSAASARPDDPGIRFPFAYRRGRLALLDDDVMFLEELASALSSNFRVVPYSHPHTCVQALLEQMRLWGEDQTVQEQVVQDCRRDAQRSIMRVLQYWASSPDRLDLVHVLLTDHLMPQMSGLQVLQALRDWPGRKALITGTTDTELAVHAFNEGLLDYFVAKNAAGIGDRIREAATTLLGRADHRSHWIWNEGLKAGQAMLLQQLDVAADLSGFAFQRWSEWVCLGEPFGILGIDLVGAGVSWLQLQQVESLEEAATAAMRAGLVASSANEIRSGRALAKIDPLRGSEQRLQVETIPAFYIGSSGALLGALQRLDPQLMPRARRPLQAGNQSKF